MKNKEIEFRLSLVDTLTAKWKSVADKMSDGAKNMVRQFERHWASISAGAYVAFNAIQRGFEMMEDWARGEVMMGAFRATMQAMGKDADEVFGRIKTAAAGLIDTDTLTEMANKWLGMGLNIEHLADVMVLARVKAREMGVTAAEAFERLSTALAAGQERGLKALNIAVDQKTAQEAYAKTLGKTADRLTDVEKRQAVLNDVLDAGKKSIEGIDQSMLTFNEKIQYAKTLWEEVKDAMGEGLATAVVSWEGAIRGLFSWYVNVAAQVVKVFAAIEDAAFNAGLTTSVSMRTAYQDVQKYAHEVQAGAGKTFEVLFGGDQSGKNLAAPITAASSAATEAIVADAKKKEVVIKKIWDAEFVSVKKYTDMIREELKQSGELVRLTAEDMKVSFGDVFALVWELNGGFQTSVLAGLDAVHSSIVDGIGSAWEEMFGEANSLLEIFIKNFVEQLGSNVVQSAISGLLSLIPGGGFLSGIFGGLFHEGGVVPKAHDGAYINASPSREFPILVRGGETVRTEAQEAALQTRGGVTFNVNVYGPVASEQAFKELVERGMRKLGVTDVSKYFRNSRSNLVLES